MKRFLIFIIVLSFSFPLFAVKNSYISAGIDLGYFEPLKDKIVFNQVEFKIKLDDDFDLIIPMNYVIPTNKSNECMAIGGGLCINYKPFNKNLFITLSLIEVEYLFGYDSPTDPLKYYNHFSLGYSFHLTKNLSIEPSFSIINPYGIYDMSALKDCLGGFPDYRISIFLSYKFFNFEIKS